MRVAAVVAVAVVGTWLAAYTDRLYVRRRSSLGARDTVLLVDPRYESLVSCVTVSLF